ncbi:MAG: BtpA/SgcQ family protein [Candidatus Liptonbacteria bacterium]
MTKKNRLNNIFGKKGGVIIGAIHFPPLLGYPDFPGFEMALKNAINDLRALEKGGVDGIIFENNYDIPHSPKVSQETVACMLYLGSKLREMTKLPMGVDVLWNDYRVALSIAKILNLQFIRIPVFVDKVKTDCGIIRGNPKDVVGFRKNIGADNVAIFTDIHVKHSKLLSRHNIISSAKLAIKNHSDGLILTGNWTGQAPDMEELKTVRRAVGDFPILIGSGTDAKNVRALFEYANGAIVSTSLKEGTTRKGEVNVKGYGQRISHKKTESLVRASSKR